MIFISTQAYATSGVFVGVDGLRTHARHEASNSSILLGPQGGSKSKSEDYGYGANLGVRFDPLFLFVSAELFYDRLNSSSKGFPQNLTGTAGHRIDMDERYGAKGNVGLTILPWFTPFVTYGVASVKYQTDISKRETAPLYGVGIMFDIPLTGVSIKAAYDMQKIDNVNYQNGHSDSRLGVAHLGLIYTFGAE